MEQIKVGRVTAKIVWDSDPVGCHPREEYDCFGKIVHWHRRYDFGEKISDVGEWFRSLAADVVSSNYPEALLEKNVSKIVDAHYVVLPVALLDHSGLRLWVGSRHSPFDPGGWDSGQVGFIYASLEDARNNWLLPKATWKTKIESKNYTKAKMDSEWRTVTPVQLTDCKITLREAAERVLTQEIETYDDWLSGSVYGYVIEGPDGEHLDSCWGFLGDEEYVKQEARASAERCDKDLDEEDVEAHEMACRDIETV
jgi:hypothetical protein